MFRRSTTLPARPSIPCKEEIIEDLSNALPDDVIYQYSKENLKDGSKYLIVPNFIHACPTNYWELFWI